RVRQLPGRHPLFECGPPLPVRIVTLAGLLRCGMAAPLRSWGVVLQITGSRPSGDDLQSILQNVPWFPDLPFLEVATDLLRDNGWLLILCDSRVEADSLLSAVKQGRVAGSLIRPTGRGARVLDSD